MKNYLRTLPNVTGYTSSQARLLMAQVQLMQGNHKQAQQSLEVGISFNFEVSLRVQEVIIAIMSNTRKIYTCICLEGTMESYDLTLIKHRILMYAIDAMFKKKYAKVYP